MNTLILNQTNLSIPEITRVYLSRGDNLYDSEGRTADKFAGLEIGGNIYWLNYGFSDIMEEFGGCESTRLLGWACLIKVHPSGRGFRSKAVPHFASLRGKAEESKPLLPVTKIALHHDDIFQENTKYWKKTVHNPYTEKKSIWWKLDELARYFNETQGALL